MEKYGQLIKHFESLKDDAVKFYENGNKAAGTRVRKGMQEIKLMAQEIRAEIQQAKQEA